jgi:hypothetical protein
MIRFPKMHIAQSVVNRILNAHDELEASMPTLAPEPTPAPHVPDPTLEGAELDLALDAPAAPVEGVEPGDPGNAAANAFESSVSGGTALGGLLDTVSGQ